LDQNIKLLDGWVLESLKKLKPKNLPFLKLEKRVIGKRGPKSDFGVQMLEKQKARYTYLLSEKQFSKYVKSAIEKQGDNREILFKTLESRLDNIVLRAGFAPTRLAARQLVSHGHLMVNDRRVTIPSYSVRVGDKISIRPKR
jgi:small subunit ribosomal protein S4